MKTKTLYVLSAVAGALLATAASSSALTINWSVAAASVSPIAPSSDIVSAAANFGSVDMIVGTSSVISAFDSFKYTLEDPGLLDETIPFDLSRNLTLNGVTQLLVQKGSDTLSLDGPRSLQVTAGEPAAVYELAGGYTVEVTVDGDAYAGGETGDTTSHNVDATFTLEGPAEAPDAGSTAMLLGMGVAGLGAFRRKLS
jgi:hypothetical protein